MFKADKTGSASEQLMWATLFHHVQLSSMADVKANILLTVSSVVMTLSIPQVIRYSHLWPLYILMGSCLLTVCLAAYAVMPKLPPITRLPPNPLDPTFNILFFGDFTRLSQMEFENSMEEILSDPNRAYGARVREIYLMGSFLAKKKYRFLRLGYVAFISGLFASFVGFMIDGLLQTSLI